MTLRLSLQIKHLNIHLLTKIGHVHPPTSATKLCDFWNKFYYKSSPNIGDNCAIFKKHHLSSKTATFWATFEKIWDTFIPTSGHTDIYTRYTSHYLAQFCTYSNPLFDVAKRWFTSQHPTCGSFQQKVITFKAIIFLYLNVRFVCFT